MCRTAWVLGSAGVAVAIVIVMGLSHASRTLNDDSAPLDRIVQNDRPGGFTAAVQTGGGPAPDADGASPDADNTFESRHMLPANCSAGSPLVDTQALGCFGPSDNMPYPVSTHDALASGRCYLLAQPNAVAELGTHRGMRLLLVNATGDVIRFPAVNSRLDIVQEAMDADGQWKPVEYLLTSWCGNSYHHVLLPAGHYWSFPVPRYRGPHITRLRFRLTIADDITLHSNEFPGSVHLTQFHLKHPYTPRNIMDTHNAVPSAPSLPQ